MRRRSSARAVRYMLLTLYGAFSVLPLVWMVSAAFKRPQDVLTIPIRWIPPVWQPGNFAQALLEPRFSGTNLLTFALNSILVAVVTSLASIVLSSFVGYGFAKFRFRGRDGLLCRPFPSWRMQAPRPE